VVPRRCNPHQWKGGVDSPTLIEKKPEKYEDYLGPPGTPLRGVPKIQKQKLSLTKKMLNTGSTETKEDPSEFTSRFRLLLTSGEGGGGRLTAALSTFSVWRGRNPREYVEGREVEERADEAAKGKKESLKN